MDPLTSIGDYQLQRVLGSGSFATVWLARDERLDATVAIKVLADNWARNAEVRRRFIDEARLLRRIEDERVVPVYTVNELPDGRPYFVMAWADRGTLLDRMDERRAGGGFNVEEATRMALGIVDCLAVVHAYGVVHRDIKPSNVLLRSRPAHHFADDGGDRIVLGDFGLAKDTAAGSGFTLAVGTPAYMAPEQAQMSATLDVRADLFSVTAVYYELLTGHPAFALDNLRDAQLRNRVESVPLADRRPGLPPGLQAVVDRGLAPDPQRRFASAAELASAITAATGHRSAVPTTGVAVGAGSFAPARTPPPIGALDAAATVIGQAANVLRDGTTIGRRAEACLRAQLRISVIGDDTRMVAALGDLGVVSQVAADDGSPADWSPADWSQADVAVVVGPLHLSPGPAAASRRRHDGPAAIVVVGDVEGEQLLPAATFPAEDSGRSVTAWLRHDVAAWFPPRCAAEALDIIDRALDPGDPAAADLAEQIERIRLAHPDLATVGILRDEAAGRLALPAGARRELRRVLVGADAGEKVGLGAGGIGDVRTLGAQGAARWRRMINTGQVPFAARAAADAVARTYDRIATAAG